MSFIKDFLLFFSFFLIFSPAKPFIIFPLNLYREEKREDDVDDGDDNDSGYESVCGSDSVSVRC